MQSYYLLYKRKIYMYSEWERFQLIAFNTQCHNIILLIFSK